MQSETLPLSAEGASSKALDQYGADEMSIKHTLNIGRGHNQGDSNLADVELAVTAPHKERERERCVYGTLRFTSFTTSSGHFAPVLFKGHPFLCNYRECRRKACWCLESQSYRGTPFEVGYSEEEAKEKIGKDRIKACAGTEGTATDFRQSLTTTPCFDHYWSEVPRDNRAASAGFRTMSAILEQPNF